jgi:hypothetical protein
MASTGVGAGEMIWLNGAFGAGKTSVAEHLLRRIPGSRLYDPEDVGLLLHRLLPEAADGDFQDIPAWRHLVAETAVALHAHTGAQLITPMTLLNPAYASEIFHPITASGLPVTHILLHADTHELRARIIGHDMFPNDPRRNKRVQAWRLDHLSTYAEALPWLRQSAHVIDTTHLTTAQTTDAVLHRLHTLDHAKTRP